MRYKATVLLFFIAVIDTSAQEMWGISNSNYSGNMGIFLNPSTIVAAPYKYDFNLIGLDVFAENNFMYIPAENKVVPRAIEGDTANKVTVQNYQHSSQHAFAHA